MIYYAFAKSSFEGYCRLWDFVLAILKCTREFLSSTPTEQVNLMRLTRLKINFTKFLTSLNFKRQRKKKYRRPKTLQLPIRSSLQLSQLSQVAMQATTRVVQVQATLKAFLLATRRQVARQVTRWRRRRRVLQLTRQEFKWPRQRRQIDL